MPDLNHYIRKTDILRGVVDGSPAKALCGEMVVPDHQGAQAIPGHEVAHRELKTCPVCENIFDSLRRDKSEQIPEPVREREEAFA
ncbi:DUF3039 domain-containing protein [Leucobacter sp. L43]|uniref:DUF3039 domain-containing protein n=1 Tax=Leucobacter sp. L43 TaxID=2798040 RepID=UPI001905EF2F|nr:DUF3039 domain-containing protein [Leucobacter sp. L43]